MLEHLNRLAHHMKWADACTLEALRAAEAPPAPALALYAHVLGAEHVWLARLQGEPSGLAVWPTLTLDGCAEASADSSRGYARFLSSLAPADLERKVKYTNSAGLSFEDAIGDILLHVFLHGAYHRGQVAQQLRAEGQTPAATDYIAFVRGTPAATQATRSAPP
ncbi:MAG TPA: DinB family protein [Candidatus Krumholzibacteria bacterium]|nr:DinB family protein [Candidatus Krumholzibacteria bacterium]